jgi:hypothetical protein
MMLSPLPLRDRIKGALRLEPMTKPELARVLSQPILSLSEEMEVMQARGDIKRLPGTCAWINVSRRWPRAVSRMAVAA